MEEGFFMRGFAGSREGGGTFKENSFLKDASFVGQYPTHLHDNKTFFQAISDQVNGFPKWYYS